MILCDLVLFREDGVVFCSDERLYRDIDFHFFSPNKDTVREMPADCSSYKHGEKSLFRHLHPGFTQPHFPFTNPPYFLPTDKWARLATEWRGREQEDDIVDQIRAGRGLDTGGELLGRQRAGGADAPWHGWRPAGADSR